MTTDQTQAFEGYAILELLGHRRLAGYLTEQQIAGAGFIRIDIPIGADGETVTQLVNPASVYAITPCSEEIAREIAKTAPAPVTRWDLRKLLPAEKEGRDTYGEYRGPIYDAGEDDVDDSHPAQEEFEDAPF